MNLMLTIPCADAKSAAEFHDLLIDEEVYVGGYVGRFVHIPWGGDPAFPYLVAVLAFENGYALESEVTCAAHQAVEVAAS